MNEKGIASMKAVHLCTAKLTGNPMLLESVRSASMKAVHLCTAKKMVATARLSDNHASMKAVHLCTAKLTVTVGQGRVCGHASMKAVHLCTAKLS